MIDDDRTAGPEDVETHGGLSLARYAEIVVTLRDVPAAKVPAALAAAGVPEAAYQAANEGWCAAMEAEIARGEIALVVRLSELREAVRRRLDAARPPRKLAGEVSLAEVEAWIARGEPVIVFDMRLGFDDEEPIMQGALRLDMAARRRLAELDRSTPLVFFCYRGCRSQAAAQHYVDEGFERAFSVAEGVGRP
jgi:rhodanese-related sulfurtransferase